MKFSVSLIFTLLLCNNLKSSEDSQNKANDFITLKLAEEREYQINRNNVLVQFSALLANLCANSSVFSSSLPFTLACPMITKKSLSHLKKLASHKNRQSYLENLRNTKKDEYDDVIRAAEYLDVGKDIAQHHVDFLWDHTITTSGNQRLQNFYKEKEKYSQCVKLLEKKIKQHPYTAQKRHLLRISDKQNNKDSHYSHYAIDYSSTGDYIALAAHDRSTIELFYPSTLESQWSQLNNVTVPTSLKYSPVANELAVVSGSGDCAKASKGMVKIWDFSAQKLKLNWCGYNNNEEKSEQCCIAYSNDGNCLVSSYKKSMHIFDPRGTLVAHPIECSIQNISALCWGPSCELFVGQKNGYVSVLDARKGYKVPVRTWQVKNGEIKNIEYERDKRSYALNRIAIDEYLYDSKTYGLITTAYNGQDLLNFGPCGHTVRSCGTNMILFDEHNKKVVQWKSDPTKAIAVHPHKLKIATVSRQLLCNGGAEDLVLWKIRKISHGNITEAIESYDTHACKPYYASQSIKLRNE
jgi:hypothetical protein